VGPAFAGCAALPLRSVPLALSTQCLRRGVGGVGWGSLQGGHREKFLTHQNGQTTVDLNNVLQRPS
jgi:hypothetical protein